MPDETPTKAWLVERSDLGGQTRWMRQLGRDWEWTTDANEATRFVSQQGAENWCGPRDDSPLRVAEHVWLDTPMEARMSDHAARQCWCRRCEDERLAHLRSFERMAARRFIVCPDCGNKRCPKATQHDRQCAGSNEPGQPGSDYA